jgi:hypothetical protein
MILVPPRQLCFARLHSLEFTNTASAVDIFCVTMNGFLDLPCEVRIVLQRTLTVGAVHLVVAAVAFKAMPVCLRIASALPAAPRTASRRTSCQLRRRCFVINLRIR